MKLVSLADLLIAQHSGYWGAEPGTSDVDVRVIRNGDISESGRIDWANLPVRGFTNGNVEKSRVTLDDVILTTSGDCGYVAHIQTRPATLTCATNFVRVLRFDPAQVVPRYIFQWMNTLRFRAMLRPFVRGTTMMNLAVAAALEKTEIPLPSLRDQLKISAQLDSAESVREKRRLHLNLLDSLVRSIFIERFGDPVANPRGFRVRPLVELIARDRPITYGILKPGPNQKDGIRYVRVVDMKEGGIDIGALRQTTHEISNQYRRSLLKGGDLLISIRGHVGRVAMVPNELDGANITQDTARLTVSEASAVFVRECLRMGGLQLWMSRRTKGVAVRGINLADVKLIPIIVPSRSMQDEFTNTVAVIEKLRSLSRNSFVETQSIVAAIQYGASGGKF